MNFRSQLRAIQALNRYRDKFGTVPYHLFRTAIDAAENGSNDSDLDSILWQCMKNQ